MPDLVIPVLNEAAALPSLLAAVPGGYRTIVVDNGSTDGSARVAEAFGAAVVFEPRRGFGAACWAGLAVASPDDGVVCFMDGDGSLDPADLPKVAEPVLRGDVDLMLGSRRPSGRGAWPLHARAANAVLTWELRRRSARSAHSDRSARNARSGGTGGTGGPPRCRVRDLGPMRAARRDELLALGLRDRGFGWPLEMVLRASEAGWRIDEVPVSYCPRVGRSKVTGTVAGTARAIRDMSLVLR